jgi:glycosyltransferase involved in cell wall biosynthesis
MTREHQNGEQFVIGTVKSLEPAYGIKNLIESFSILIRRKISNNCGPDVRLVIAGEGSLRKSLEEVARRLRVDDRTTFLGSVPNSTVPELVNGFSVFAALSVSESFGVAVLEASACGVPVVVTDVGGLPEVATDGVTGLMVPAQNPEAAADAFSRLLNDENLRHSLGANGRSFVLEKYNWSDCAEKIDAVYESVAAGDRSGYVGWTN